MCGLLVSRQSSVATCNDDNCLCPHRSLSPANPKSAPDNIQMQSVPAGCSCVSHKWYVLADFDIVYNISDWSSHACHHTSTHVTIKNVAWLLAFMHCRSQLYKPSSSVQVSYRYVVTSYFAHIGIPDQGLPYPSGTLPFFFGPWHLFVATGGFLEYLWPHNKVCSQKVCHHGQLYLLLDSNPTTGVQQTSQWSSTLAWHVVLLLLCTTCNTSIVFS